MLWNMVDKLKTHITSPGVHWQLVNVAKKGKYHLAEIIHSDAFKSIIWHFMFRGAYSCLCLLIAKKTRLHQVGKTMLLLVLYWCQKLFKLPTRHGLDKSWLVENKMFSNGTFIHLFSYSLTYIQLPQQADQVNKLQRSVKVILTSTVSYNVHYN